MKNFFFRNKKYCIKNPRAAREVTKVMRLYKQDHPNCEWCGRDNPLHVHHLEPVSYAPERAADPTNLICLCAKRCHLTVGHGGNYKDYIVHCRYMCDNNVIVKPYEKTN